MRPSLRRNAAARLWSAITRMEVSVTGLLPYGTPVYENAKSLEATRYFPDSVESTRMCDFVEAHGGEAFFEKPDWRATLFSELEGVRRQAPPAGGHETPDERRRRYEHEMVESKRIIREKIGADPTVFIFPGGGYNDESFEVAGTIFETVAVRAPESHSILNRPGDDPRKLSRLGTQFISIGGRGGYSGGAYLVDFLDEYRGSGWARRRRQVRKLFYLMGMRLGIWP